MFTCESSRVSGTICPTLKTVYTSELFVEFRAAFDIVHFENLDEAVQRFSHLRTPFPDMISGVRAELRVPKSRECGAIVLQRCKYRS